MNKIVCLMGPTASGKTALACQLVDNHPFEIISVDSAMIYRGLDIGTAKPGEFELKAYPHHLINICDPTESFSASDFCEKTLKLCREIFSRAKIPLLVGGTMMYFHALQQGLSALPKASAKLRGKILQEATEKGWAHLHQELKKLDPQSAERIHSHDTVRIQRALEVYYLTEQPLSYWLSQEKKEQEFQFMNCILMPEDRAWLHKRIALRFETMLQQGFLQEVENLLQKWPLTLEHPALRAVGYRQAYTYLCGQIDYATFLNQGLAATRQLAKRQMTWLRHWKTGVYLACDKLPSLRAVGEAIQRPLKLTKDTSCQTNKKN